jgi:uncharacterized membrane protein YeaQ/YmgE (transglycosylase-associated protein family)
MRKTIMLFLTMALSVMLYSTTFTDINAGFTVVQNSFSAWGDYDNDGDLDILISGNYTAIIYRNNGNGTFSNINAGLTGVDYGSVAWGDYDNDGDLDILLTGDSGGTYVSKIYRNNGNSTFTDINAGLLGVSCSSAVWGDYNNDGYLDLLLSGLINSSNCITKIYRNNGNGTFSDINAGFSGIAGSVAWGDYDNDGDLDFLLVGWNGSSRMSKIYRNDGNNVFIDINNNLIGVSGSAEWGDYDNDGNLDIILIGQTAGIENITKIYRNNGYGIFNDINAGLIGVSSGSARWGDYDNDGDLDILVTGYIGSPSTKIYRNNNNGTFTDINFDLPGVWCGFGSWGDYDNDGDLDISITGSGISKIFRNDGTSPNTNPTAPTNLSAERSGEYIHFHWDNSSDLQTPSLGLNYVIRIGISVNGGQISSPMANSSGYRLIPVKGHINSNHSWKILRSALPDSIYWSVQAIDGAFAGSDFAVEQLVIVCPNSFTDIEGYLTGLRGASVAWGDYDNDDDLDILLTGENSSGNQITKIYRNNGNDTFIDINAGLTNVSHGSVSWGDYDNDGDLDILLSGFTGGTSRVTKVYRNDGNGMFTDINAGLTGIMCGAVAWGDYDNDGDLDILVTGDTGSISITRIYENNGNESFTDINADLPGLYYSSVAWGDYDNDGDLDILLIGGYFDTTHHNISRIYRNDGNGTFIDIEANLFGLYNGSVAWGDYDNDGMLDVLITGEDWYNSTSFRYAFVYHNNGDNTFTDINAGLTGVLFGSCAWGDLDNDGYLDILLTGALTTMTVTTSTIIYHNNGGNSFTDINTNIPDVGWSSVAWGDYDNDGDLDILIAGDNVGGGFISRVYRNDSNIPNSVPSAPSNLSASIAGDYIVFQWENSTDSQTPVLGLNYVLKIGNTSEGIQLSSPMSNSTGYRLIQARGYANSNCTWKIHRASLPEFFYWSTQAIDGAYSGSLFAQEQGYNIQPTITLLSNPTLQYGDIPIYENSDWFEIVVMNTGYPSLIITDLSLYETTSQFNHSYINLNVPILPGETDTILVRFSPVTVGAIIDTIYIESNDNSTPILKVRLMGTGTYVPPKLPENLIIAQNGNDMHLSWDAVIQDIHNNPITPDGYIILYSEDEISYFFLWVTTNTDFIHPQVAHFRDNMFYKVIAYKDFGRANLERLLGLNGTKQKLRLEDLKLD